MKHMLVTYFRLAKQKTKHTNKQKKTIIFFCYKYKNNGDIKSS